MKLLPLSGPVRRRCSFWVSTFFLNPRQKSLSVDISAHRVCSIAHKPLSISCCSHLLNSKSTSHTLNTRPHAAVIGLNDTPDKCPLLGLEMGTAICWTLFWGSICIHVWRFSETYYKKTLDDRELQCLCSRHWGILNNHL